MHAWLLILLYSQWHTLTHTHSHTHSYIHTHTHPCAPTHSHTHKQISWHPDQYNSAPLLSIVSREPFFYIPLLVMFLVACWIFVCRAICVVLLRKTVEDSFIDGIQTAVIKLRYFLHGINTRLENTIYRASKEDFTSFLYTIDTRYEANYEYLFRVFVVYTYNTLAACWATSGTFNTLAACWATSGTFNTLAASWPCIIKQGRPNP